jgi:hypothetical protein
MFKASKMLIVLGILLLSTSLVGQNLIDIDDYIDDLRNSKSVFTEYDVTIENLYCDLQTTLIAKSDEYKIVGNDTPIVMYVDFVNLSLLYEQVKEYDNIQMIIISIDDNFSENVLTDSHLLEFSSLRYLVFKCNGNCVQIQIEALINVNTTSGVEFFYSNLIPN